MSIIFEPLKVGDIYLNNRIIMAPLTRARTDDDRVPNELMLEYYTQRASAGMIITEATAISPTALGYANTPGIWSTEQIQGWKKITDAVHAKGGKIVVQLWHVGRISDPIFLDGNLPVAPSAVKPHGHVSLVRPKRDFVTPRALSLAEIEQILNDYEQAAVNAKLAGFDGVELHGANGYLPDQFLQDSTNLRTDLYGGSLVNRARFMLDTVDRLIKVWGNGRVGVHLSPKCDLHDMGDSDKVATFTYLVQQLNNRKIAFIFSRELIDDNFIGDKLKKVFDGVYIINQGLDFKIAYEMVDAKKADAASWGQLFLANPDLVKRFKLNLPLNTPNPETFYIKGSVGYTDYPFS